MPAAALLDATSTFSPIPAPTPSTATKYFSINLSILFKSLTSILSIWDRKFAISFSFVTSMVLWVKFEYFCINSSPRVSNGFDEDLAKNIFEHILKFASYGFNRSHSVAYSIISYKMAYLKANYNKYFMKNLLDNVIGTIITKEYIYECKTKDIKIFIGFW